MYRAMDHGGESRRPRDLEHEVDDDIEVDEVRAVPPQSSDGVRTQIINSYYSNLVNIVYAFGGDIIKIAGDALYCVFMPDDNDLRGAILCAAMCSIMLRDVSQPAASPADA